MQLVFANDFYEIKHDAARQLVVIRRSSLGLSGGSLAAILPDVTAALRPLRGRRLLIDVRLAPGNNDPAIEQSIQHFRRQLVELFAVRATLVATATGLLQINRLGRERGESNQNIFRDEAEAIAHLMTRPL